MRMRLFFFFLSMAVSALADDTVVSTRREARGYQPARPEEADFIVVVTYTVPGVIHDSDTYGFKRFWSEVTQHADGSVSETVAGGSWSGKSRDGLAGWCGGAANVQVRDTGPNVTLELSWGGKRSGHLKREVPVSWSELDKTVKDNAVEIHVVVLYRKA